jgi:predicted DNA-binding transcriptional regulator AlpA
MSPETLADYLDLSVRTVEKLRACGQLPPPVRMPLDLRLVRWRREDVDSAVASWAAVGGGDVRRAG